MRHIMQAFLDDPSVFISVLALICSVVLPLWRGRRRVRLEVYRVPQRPDGRGEPAPEYVRWFRLRSTGGRQPVDLMVCGYRCSASLTDMRGRLVSDPPALWPADGVPAMVWRSDLSRPLDASAYLIVLWRSRPSGRLHARDIPVGRTGRRLPWRERRDVFRRARAHDWQALARLAG